MAALKTLNKAVDFNMSVVRDSYHIFTWAKNPHIQKMERIFIEKLNAVPAVKKLIMAITAEKKKFDKKFEKTSETYNVKLTAHSKKISDITEKINELREQQEEEVKARDKTRSEREMALRALGKSFNETQEAIEKDLEAMGAFLQQPTEKTYRANGELDKWPLLAKDVNNHKKELAKMEQEFKNDMKDLQMNAYLDETTEHLAAWVKQVKKIRKKIEDYTKRIS